MRAPSSVLVRVPTQITVAALLLAWLARLGTGVGLPVAPLRYLDVVLVPLALGLCAVVRLESILRFRWWLAAGGLFAAAGVVSAVVHGLSFVQLLIGVLLYLVPFMACLVVATEPDDRLARSAVYIPLGIVALQVPLVLVQWIKYGVGDEVRGTLVGAGAGAHLAGAAALVGVALLWALRRGWLLVLAASVVALAVIYVADAKQVGAAIPLAVMLMLIVSLRGRGVSSGRLALVATGSIVVLGAPMVWLLSQTYVANILRLTVDSGGGKVAVVKALCSDLFSGPVSALFGLGPGETVSRWSWMLSGLDATSAPLTAFGLSTSERAAAYEQVALGQGYVGDSSFSYSLSSGLGVLGDYGLLGLIAYATLSGLVLWALVETRSRLGAACVGLIGGLVVLGLIGDWLEQTPITIMIFIVAGAAMRGRQVPAEDVPARIEAQSS